ncbi:MAG: discoidin domain-containing protein [Elusimicrobia bacterium]|nr:discoidin domain-containing protein [Elusimicrobiota bacterium]
MRNWIILGIVFGICFTCTGQLEARKKVISKKVAATKQSDDKGSKTASKKKGSVTDIKIEAEDFDKGGEGVGYHDKEARNFGEQYRTDEGVDIEVNPAGGYDVGWVMAGEWLKYTVDIKTAGTYTIEVQVGATGKGGTFHIEFDDVDKTGPMTVPDTGGWQTWQTITKTGVSLSEGKHVMKLAMDTNGAGAVGNFDYIILKLGGEQSESATEEKPTKTSAKKQDSVAGNIAKGKPVTASSIESGATPIEGAVDGVTSTRWASAASDPQWIRIDLGAVYDIKKVILNWEAAYGKDYEIQVSNDDTKWTTIYTKTDGMGGVEEIPLKGSGRYIRMYGTRRGVAVGTKLYGFSLYEFEVYCQ